MKKITLLSLLIIVSIVTTMAKPLPYRDSKLSIEERAKDLLGRMTLEEKVQVVTGASITKGMEIYSMDVERLGIPNFKIEHGPYGFKGFLDTKEPMVIGTYYPVSIAQAATWDRELVEQINAGMGEEMHAAGGHANAGPAMNIIRDPRGGRSFEYFTEDPYLNGEIATAYVKGLQSQKVMANLKHYACNNQEYNRHKVSVEVDERTLREVYLPGFKAAIQKGEAWSVMGAYNLVNGTYCCEDPFLLQQVLREDWDFKGFVVSDWAATHSTAPSINAGLDLEMPRERWYGEKLIEAVKSGEVKIEMVDRAVDNILRGLLWTGCFDERPSLDHSKVRSAKNLAVAREAAAGSMVLLKNDNNNLPIDTKKIKSIAVIGPNGDYGKHYMDGKYSSFHMQGGGSAHLRSAEGVVVTPYQGIKEELAKSAPDVKVSYAPGCYAETGCGSINPKYLKSASGKNGADVTYFSNMKFEGAPSRKNIDTLFNYMWIGANPIPEAGRRDGNDQRFSVRWEATLTAPATRDYTFESRTTAGAGRIYIDDKLVVANEKGNRYLFCEQGTIHLEKGKEYRLRMEYIKTGGTADFRIGWDYENVEWLEQAKELAKSSDAVILCVGLSGQMGETEAGDRRHLNLFPAQENLIREIGKINKNTTVAITAGSAITMQSWMDSVPSIIMSWYAGEQGGYALLDLVTGEVSPSGRLPITFPLSLDQYPADFHSKGETVQYKEGLYVGYKYFEKEQKDLLFPFGYGMSYTQFKYSDMSAKVVGDNKVEVSATITNTGSYDGEEVVQLYVGDVKCSVDRPAKELKEFAKVFVAKGKSQKVTFTLESEAFQFWSPTTKDWVVEPGEFVIYLGASATDMRCNKSVKL